METYLLLYKLFRSLHTHVIFLKEQCTESWAYQASTDLEPSLSWLPFIVLKGAIHTTGGEK